MALTPRGCSRGYLPPHQLAGVVPSAEQAQRFWVGLAVLWLLTPIFTQYTQTTMHQVHGGGQKTTLQTRFSAVQQHQPLRSLLTSILKK